MHRNLKKDHLRLAFGCEGGGGCGKCVETTFDSCLDAREVAVMVEGSKHHLQLAFGREGGGGGSAVGVTDVSGGLRKKEWEKTGNDKFVIARFHDALRGPPTSWVPPRICPSPTLPLVD